MADSGRCAASVCPSPTPPTTTASSATSTTTKRAEPSSGNRPIQMPPLLPERSNSISTSTPSPCCLINSTNPQKPTDLAPWCIATPQNPPKPVPPSRSPAVAFTFYSSHQKPV